MKVVEKMLSPLDEYLLELPYQQRVLQMGREEGLAKGREEGVLAGLRELILETIALRFNPPAQEYRQVGQQLEDIARRETLHRLFVTAIQAEDMAAFASHLEEELSDQSDQ